MRPGPTFGTPLSLYRTPLGSVLPAEPTGNVFEQGFMPRVTDVGRAPSGDRATCPANRPTGKTAPAWGRWFRHDRGASRIAAQR